MGSQVNIGGTWKDINGVYVNVGGAWKTASSMRCNIGGTWKDGWSSIGGIDAYTKLMLHMNGTNDSTTFTDSSLSPKTVTANGNVCIKTAEKVFGSGSAYFDGTGDYLSLADSDDWSLGINDFTVDCWIKREIVGVSTTICMQIDSALSTGSTSFGLSILSTNVVQGQINSGTTSYLVQSVSTITDNSWHHLALVRNGNTLCLFIDGVLSGSRDITGLAVNDSPNPLVIGKLGDYAGYYWNGYIDEFRVSKGIARWTADFTPPTQEYSA